MSALNTKCPKVINIRKKELNKLGYNDFEDWATLDVNNLYIGRNMNYYVNGTYKSKWHNPFSIKKYGEEKSLELFEDYILKNIDLMNDLHELEGKTLGCWCKPEKCHGDILIKLWIQQNKDRIVEFDSDTEW
jgi:hypothetical protein